MKKATQWNITITLILLVTSLWLLYPTYKYYAMDSAQRERLHRVDDPILDKILRLGLDLQGGMHLTLEVDLERVPPEIEKSEAMGRALEVIRNRVDQFGVSEPLIVKQGDRWIVVQLPGVSDTRRALELIGKTALLEFKLVSDAEMPSEEDVPDDLEILSNRDGRRFLVKKEAELTGASLRTARVGMGGDFNRPHIAFTMKPEASKKFERITGSNIDRQLAIVLDEVVQSAPVIRSRIAGGEGIIEGNFTLQTARDLAIVLRAGALPAPVNIIENRTVGPTLGRDSITAGMKAMGLGFLLVLVFMVFYYKKSGLIANAALIMNIIFLMGVMAYFQFTLTLPGIAGIVLIIGMAVDANVLIFERIREELIAGKTPRVAIDAGFNKAVKTILDANITTLVASVFLFQFGTGPIRGFAITLFIGIMASMFTAIVGTKTIFDIITQDRNVGKLSI